MIYELRRILMEKVIRPIWTVRGLIRLIWTAELITAIALLIVKAATDNLITLSWFWCSSLVWMPFALELLIVAMTLIIKIIFHKAFYQSNGLPRKYGEKKTMKVDEKYDFNAIVGAEVSLIIKPDPVLDLGYRIWKVIVRRYTRNAECGVIWYEAAGDESHKLHFIANDRVDSLTAKIKIKDMTPEQFARLSEKDKKRRRTAKIDVKSWGYLKEENQ